MGGSLTMKREYYEGQKALERFDKGMVKLFQVPKDSTKEKPKPKRKRKTTSKD
jgi:hypothetical protein